MKNSILFVIPNTARALSSKAGLTAVYGISLYRNAFFLILHAGANTVFGFVFWILAARSYPAEEVGLASAALSVAGLLLTLSNFGLDFGIVRFLASSGQRANALVNSCFTIGGLSAVVASVVFLAGLGFWSPDLAFLRRGLVMPASFVLVVASWAIYVLLHNAFVAHRKSGFTLIEATVQGAVKLTLVAVLAGLVGSLGILVSWGAGFVAALLVGLLLLLPRVQGGYRPALTIRKETVGRITRFSLANYLAGLINKVPTSILPLIVVGLVGAEQNAYFYMAYAIVSNGLYLIPTSLSLSLFAEGSHDEASLGTHVRRSLKVSFLILVPLVILLFFVGDKILLVFGQDYSTEATNLLRVLALSALPATVNNIYRYQKRVQKQMGVVIGLNVLVTAIVLGLSFFLLPRMGIMGAGIARLTASGIVTLLIAAEFLLKRRT